MEINKLKLYTVSCGSGASAVLGNAVIAVITFSQCMFDPVSFSIAYVQGNTLAKISL